MLERTKSILKKVLFKILCILCIVNYSNAQVYNICKEAELLTFTLPLEFYIDPVICAQVGNIELTTEVEGVNLNFNEVEVFYINPSSNFSIPSVILDFQIETGPISEEDTCTVLTHPIRYYILVSGRSEECPVKRNICKGEETIIGLFPLGVIEPADDESPWDQEYILTDEHGTIVKSSTHNFKVSPKETTAYSLTWDASGAIPSTGTGYFLVEVEDCDSETDIEAIIILYPTLITDQNPSDILAFWQNNGPGYVSSANFVLEINGTIIETQNWEGAFEANSEMSIRFNPYSFEPNQSNKIRIWSESPGEISDLNLLNDTTSYTYPAYEAQPDLALSQFLQPALPISTQSSTIEVLVESFGNVFVNDFTINWTLNGVDQTPFAIENANWTNRETSEASLNVVFQTINLDPAIDNTIVAWVTLPDGQTDINPKNDQIKWFYSATNANYYNADSVITICRGKEVSFEFRDTVETRITCYDCTKVLENSVWKLNDTFLPNETRILITPEESTFLSFRASSNTVCEPILWPLYPPYECINLPGPGDGLMYTIENDTINITYGIIVLDCPISPSTGTFNCE